MFHNSFMLVIAIPRCTRNPFFVSIYPSIHRYHEHHSLHYSIPTTPNPPQCPSPSPDLPTPAEFVPSLYATGTFSMRKTTGRDLQQKPTAQEVAYNPSALAVLSASDLLDNVQPGSSSKSAKSVTMCLPPPMLHQDSYNSKMAELDRDLIGQQSTSEKPTSDYTETIKRRKSLWEQPQGSVLRTIWWAYTWPIKCLLTICIPNPKTWRRLYPITFIMCVLFIGLNSYMIVWMITIMGKILEIE